MYEEDEVINSLPNSNIVTRDEENSSDDGDPPDLGSCILSDDDEISSVEDMDMNGTGYGDHDDIHLQSDSQKRSFTNLKDYVTSVVGRCREDVKRVNDDIKPTSHPSKKQRSSSNDNEQNSDDVPNPLHSFKKNKNSALSALERKRNARKRRREKEKTESERNE